MPTTEKVVFPLGQDENFKVTLDLLDADGEAIQIVGVQTEGQASSDEIDYLQNRIEGELLWTVYDKPERALRVINKTLASISQSPASSRRRTPTVPTAAIISRKAVPMDEFPTEPDEAAVSDEGFPTRRDDEPVPVLAAPAAAKKKEGVYKCGACGQLGHNKRTCPNK